MVKSDVQFAQMRERLVRDQENGRTLTLPKVVAGIIVRTLTLHLALQSLCINRTISKMIKGRKAKAMERMANKSDYLAILGRSTTRAF